MKLCSSNGREREDTCDTGKINRFMKSTMKWMWQSPLNCVPSDGDSDKTPGHLVLKTNAPSPQNKASHLKSNFSYAVSFILVGFSGEETKVKGR